MNKVTEFDVLKINRGKKKLCDCETPRYEVDVNNHIVMCMQCGAIVEPFDALLKFGERIEEYQDTIAHLKKRIESESAIYMKEFKRRVNTKAIKDMDARYKENMVPICPICEKAFDPMSVRRYVNRDVAMREYLKGET